MAHFAEIDGSNIVTRVIVIDDEHEADGENWCHNFLGGTWKKTSFNTKFNVHALGGTPFRKNYAGVGSTYDATRDAFYPASPFASWVLNDTTCKWECPIDLPADTSKAWHWDEDAYQADNSTGWVETEGT